MIMNQSFGQLAARHLQVHTSRFVGSAAGRHTWPVFNIQVLSDPFLDVVAKGYRADVLVVSARIAICSASNHCPATSRRGFGRLS